MGLFPLLRSAQKIITTEWILGEIGNGLSRKDRQGAVDFIRQCYATNNLDVLPVNKRLFLDAVDRYEERHDKDWGITDFISFLVMEQNGLTEVFTQDNDFRQAGFNPLMAVRSRNKG